MSAPLSAQSPDPAKHAAPAARIPCPTCSYDLSGTINSWKDACPLEGVCSECGAPIEWSRIFTVAPAPPWSCEHAQQFSIPKLIRTATMLLRPRAYWRSISPELPVRPWRLTMMTVVAAMLGYLGLVAYYVLAGIVVIGIARLRDGNFRRLADIWGDIVSTALDFPTLRPVGGRPLEEFDVWLVPIAIGIVLVAGAFVSLLPECRRDKPRSPQHLFRALTMLAIGLVAVHVTRVVLVCVASLTCFAISKESAMWFGMIFFPMAFGIRTSACMVLVYGATFWVSYILIFLERKSLRMPIIIAWFLICTGLISLWAYPYVMWFLRGN